MVFDFFRDFRKHSFFKPFAWPPWGSSYLNVTTTDGYYYHFGDAPWVQKGPGGPVSETPGGCLPGGARGINQGKAEEFFGETMGFFGAFQGPPGPEFPKWRGLLLCRFTFVWDVCFCCKWWDPPCCWWYGNPAMTSWGWYIVYPIIYDGFCSGCLGFVWGVKKSHDGIRRISRKVRSCRSCPQRYNMENVETESPNERNWAMKNKKPPYFSIKYWLFNRDPKK